MQYVLAVIASVFGVYLALALAAARCRNRLPTDRRPSREWLSALVVVLVVDAFLTLGFLVVILGFNCHGGYECPL